MSFDYKCVPFGNLFQQLSIGKKQNRESYEIMDKMIVSIDLQLHFRIYIVCTLKCQNICETPGNKMILRDH